MTTITIQKLTEKFTDTLGEQKAENLVTQALLSLEKDDDNDIDIDGVNQFKIDEYDDINPDTELEKDEAKSLIDEITEIDESNMVSITANSVSTKIQLDKI